MLHFAQLSDIHINHIGDHHDVLAGQAAGFLQTVINQLNQRADLDFVLISGDAVDLAHPDEITQFEAAMRPLTVPYYVIPGNHDRRAPEADIGLSRYDFAQRFNPQIYQRPPEPSAQCGYWSMTVKPNIQLIGLDSIQDEDWGGQVDEQQMAWLKQELTAHADKLIIVAIHHPLHPQTPLDRHPDWQNFVCHSGPELLALFDEHPSVKLVLTGHRHVTKADWFGARLHLGCPAISMYPCAYRTIQLEPQPDGPWRVRWQTHAATDEATIATARETMLQTWLQVKGFEPTFVEQHVALSLGEPADQTGEAILK